MTVVASILLPLLASVPVFKGFEGARYQTHDAVVAKCVKEFNRHRGAWADANRAQAKTIRDLTPELVKSHMIQESGGGDARSKAAWEKDPLQVNVPGDWGDEKSSLGLKKPTRRNEGDTEQNIRAAIKYLVRKGFSKSGKPVRKVSSQEFAGWDIALERYNSRTVLTESGRQYCEDYADVILRRADTPGHYFPIEIRLAGSTP